MRVDRGRRSRRSPRCGGSRGSLRLARRAAYRTSKRIQGLNLGSKLGYVCFISSHPKFGSCGPWGSERSGMHGLGRRVVCGLAGCAQFSGWFRDAPEGVAASFEGSYAWEMLGVERCSLPRRRVRARQRQGVPSLEPVGGTFLPQAFSSPVHSFHTPANDMRFCCGRAGPHRNAAVVPPSPTSFPIHGHPADSSKRLLGRWLAIQRLCKRSSRGFRTGREPIRYATSMVCNPTNSDSSFGSPSSRSIAMTSRRFFSSSSSEAA